MTVRNRGRLDRQSASRNGQGVGTAIATLAGDWLSIDTSVDQPVTMTLKLTATTDAVVLLASRIVVTNVG
jgi:outer membrane scaffolding protein for murein synthesis (MipA/OmpV family)